MRFIFFTKTDWAEPPRLRHQLALLLADAGHEIIFLQRPAFPGQKVNRDNSGHAKIQIFRHRQLIHHKLRLHSLIHRFNGLFEVSQTRNILSKFRINGDDVIVNFNYDYYFIRDTLPVGKIITIINDDFWSRALGGYELPLKWALKRTLRSSDVVLTVSVPLQNELNQIRPTDLFFPWADKKYKAPIYSASRNTILFWGYINNRLDFDFLFELASKLIDYCSDLKLLFVGPIDLPSAMVRRISYLSNISLLPPADLENIDLSGVFVGLIPYRSGVKSIDAATLPNKTLRILAKGLPLAITGMPNFVQEPFVFRLGQGINRDIALLKTVQRDFSGLQAGIREFVEANSSESRLKQFLSYL